MLLGAVVGCLDFDEQEVYGEHDQKADRMVFVIQYRGLHATKEIEQAEQQFREAVRGHTVALMGNWPFSFGMDEARASLSAPPEEGEKTPPQLRKDLLQLVERMEVLNAGFYLDSAGRVCGAQVVTIEKAADTIILANRIINGAIIYRAQQEAPKDAYGWMIVECARKGQTWLELKGQSLIVSVPLPEKELAELRPKFVMSLADSAEVDIGLELHGLKQLLSNPVMVWHEDATLRVKVGFEGQPSRHVTKPRQGKYRGNLVEHVQGTYGFHVVENVARYLVDPAAPARSEAERAAKLMAPRLSKADLVGVLVSRLKDAPSGELWAKLRAVPAEPEMQAAAELGDRERLALWERWLKEQVSDTAEGDDE